MGCPKLDIPWHWPLPSTASQPCISACPENPPISPDDRATFQPPSELRKGISRKFSWAVAALEDQDQKEEDFLAARRPSTDLPSGGPDPQGVETGRSYMKRKGNRRPTDETWQ